MLQLLRQVTAVKLLVQKGVLQRKKRRLVWRIRSRPNYTNTKIDFRFPRVCEKQWHHGLLVLVLLYISPGPVIARVYLLPDLSFFTAVLTIVIASTTVIIPIPSMSNVLDSASQMWLSRGVFLCPAALAHPLVHKSDEVTSASYPQGGFYHNIMCFTDK